MRGGNDVSDASQEVTANEGTTMEDKLAAVKNLEPLILIWI